MHLGIITVRDKEYYSTRRLIEAAGTLGHRASLIHPYHRWPVIKGGQPGVVSNALYDLPDVVLPRQGAQIGHSCLVLIRHLESMGIPLVNGSRAIRLTSNQFLTLQALAAAGIPVPDTLFINAVEGIRQVGQSPEAYPIVVKEINGLQGSGIELVENETALKRIVKGRLDKTQGLLLQKYIPTEGRQDYRIMVIGGKVTGAMRLLLPADEFRANYHLGAKSKAWTPTETAAEIALAAARALGLSIAGVDLVMDRAGRASVLEVNYAPGFKGLEQATGLDIAKKIVAYAAGVGGPDH